VSHVEVRGVTKSFGPVRALDDVSVDLHQGEIHALVGGNGSGKSTLIKILGGVYGGDHGRIVVGDHQYEAARATPRAAREAGLRIVHQNAGTFPGMSVAENLVIGRGYPTGATKTIRWRQTRRYAAEVIERYGINARVDSPIEELRAGARMQVAIARCLEEGREALGDNDLRAGDRVLVLDEPTASLPAREATELADALRRYAAAGETILFVSHRLDEVFGLADRITVLRDGRVVASQAAAELDQEKLIEIMLGRPLDRVFPDRATGDTGEVVLRATALCTGPLHDIELTLRRREIVGIVGLLGSGRSELLLSLFGALPRTGVVSVHGAPLEPANTARAMACGVALVPEDRLTEGAFLDQSVADNLSVARLSRYFRRGLWRSAAAHREAGEVCTRYGVRAASTNSLLSTLSGGNQQKVVLARWMQREPTVLLLDEPTQGVDVTARAEIYRIVRAAADGGAGVLIASSDFEEVANLCDRVLVLRHGTVAEEAHQPLTAEQLTRLAYGTAVRARPST
jgi:ribose transport system ATP-binding protein